MTAPLSDGGALEALQEAAEAAQATAPGPWWHTGPLGATTVPDYLFAASHGVAVGPRDDWTSLLLITPGDGGPGAGFDRGAVARHAASAQPDAVLGLLAWIREGVKLLNSAAGVMGDLPRKQVEPDWFPRYLALTDQHEVLADEGWEPGCAYFDALERDGVDPADWRAEVHDEVNAPDPELDRPCHRCARSESEE